MLHRRWRAIAWSACCALGGLGLGCLDAGPTPLGRHLGAGRAPEQVQLVDGPVGAPRRILLLRATPDGGGLNAAVSTVDDPGPGADPVTPRGLGDGVGILQGSCMMPPCTPPIDSRGRLFVLRPYETKVPGDPQSYFTHQGLVRVDPATGEEHDFGEAQSLIISADRTRVAARPWTSMLVTFQPSPSPPPPPPPPAAEVPFIVIDADDTQTMLPGKEPLFAGDDLYYVSDDRRLQRLARGSVTPESLAEGVDHVYAYGSARGFLLGLQTYPDPKTGGDSHTSLFDPALPAARATLALPPVTAKAIAFRPSPSGRYVATQGPPQSVDSGLKLTIFDRDTGQEAVASQQFAPASDETWRPHHDETWFVGVGDDVFRWKPDGSPEQVGHGASPSSYAIPGWPSSQEVSFNQEQQPVFTPDGQFRFVLDGSRSEREHMDLQSADDATAPPFRLNQPAMGIAGLWPLTDGRLLVESWLTDAGHSDIYLVDPVARTQREIDSTGNVVASGSARCLALLHWVVSSGSGDLTIVDYATGAQTLIAENVHAVAVDTSADPNDALAPGTRVAFLVRNRIASPYDGLWVIELP